MVTFIHLPSYTFQKGEGTSCASGAIHNIPLINCRFFPPTSVLFLRKTFIILPCHHPCHVTQSSNFSLHSYTLNYLSNIQVPSHTECSFFLHKLRFQHCTATIPVQGTNRAVAIYVHINKNTHTCMHTTRAAEACPGELRH